MDPRIRTYIEGEEGRRRKPYLCPSGYWTVGVGRNVETNPPTLEELLAIMDGGISDDAVDLMFTNDLEGAAAALRGVFPSFDGWPPARQCAVISVYFTVGLRGLLGFSRMVRALRDGRWADAARELLDSRRSRETLKNSPRDEEEARMLETGDFA